MSEIELNVVWIVKERRQFVGRFRFLDVPRSGELIWIAMAPQLSCFRIMEIEHSPQAVPGGKTAAAPSITAIVNFVEDWDPDTADACDSPESGK